MYWESDSIITYGTCFIVYWFIVKVYLRYKTITSQNVPSKAQIRNFFILQKNYVPFSRYPNMSTIKNGQIFLYCYFNKIIKETGTTFQSPAFSQKHVRNVFHTAY